MLRYGETQSSFKVLLKTRNKQEMETTPSTFCDQKLGGKKKAQNCQVFPRLGKIWLTQWSALQLQGSGFESNVPPQSQDLYLG